MSVQDPISNGCVHNIFCSLLTVGIVTAYFGIHVSYHQEQIMQWNIIDSLL